MNLEELLLIKLNTEEFNKLPKLLKAICFEYNGDWDSAHQLIQWDNDEYSAWFHAYLHRKEGDQWNSSYWYSRAKKNKPTISLKDELDFISKQILLNFKLN